MLTTKQTEILLTCILLWSSCASAEEPIIGTPGYPCIASDDSSCQPDTTFLTCVLISGTNIGVCECTVDSNWDESISKCSVKAGHTCVIGVDAQPCTKFSTCFDGGNGAKCMCQTGSVAFGGSCVATIGNACDATLVDNPACIGGAFLSCNANNWCECQSGTVVIGAECKAAMDAPCNVPGQAPECRNDAFLSCTENVCRCKSGTVLSGTECRAEMDAPCNVPGESPACVSDSFLTCTVDNVCGCSTDSIWDESVSKCVLRAGATCAVGVDEQPCTKFSTCTDSGNGSDFTCTCQQDTVNVGGVCKATIDKPCDSTGITNPDCDSTNFLVCNSIVNICECEWGTVNQENVCKAMMGQPCTADGGAEPICDATSFLECSANICRCRPGHVEMNGKCSANFGDSCDSAGVICDISKYLECSTTSKKCECRQGLVANGDGECRAVIGGDCASDLPCDETNFLECDPLSKKCACRPGLVANDGECQGTLGEVCGSEGFPPNCDESGYLVCGPDKKCECMAGLIDNGRGECRAMLGGTCNFNLPCDESSYLVCGAVSGKCECVEGMVDNGSGACRVMLGGACSESLPCDDANFLECSAINHKCVCKPDFADNGNGQCRVILGGDCLVDEHCDEYNFAECHVITKKCVCRTGFQDNGHGKCRVLIGGDCTTDQHCDESNFLHCGATSQKCVCMIGFVLNPQGNCRVVLGGGCQFDGQCDENNSLQCGTNDLCECIPPLIPNERGECVTPSGQRQFQLCNSNDPLPCDQNVKSSSFSCWKAGLFSEPTNHRQFHNCGADENGKLIDVLLTCPGTTVWRQEAMECQEPSL